MLTPCLIGDPNVYSIDQLTNPCQILLHATSKYPRKKEISLVYSPSPINVFIFRSYITYNSWIKWMIQLETSIDCDTCIKLKVNWGTKRTLSRCKPPFKITSPSFVVVASIPFGNPTSMFVIFSHLSYKINFIYMLWDSRVNNQRSVILTMKTILHFGNIQNIKKLSSLCWKQN